MKFSALALALAATVAASPVDVEPRQSGCQKLTCSMTGTVLRASQLKEWTGLIVNQALRRTGTTGSWSYTVEPSCPDLKCSAAIVIDKVANTGLELRGTTYSQGYAVLNYVCTASSC